MTMPPAAHPDPERLAALAGDDAEARADHALIDHVAACAACGQQVGEMTTLRAALADLPDLTPSRPLQLVPPVPATAPSGWRIAVRRAFAPLAVAGMVLVLVGGIGATGALGPADAPRISLFFGQQGASAPDSEQPEAPAGEGGQTDGLATDDAGQPAPASPLTESGGTGALHQTPEPPGDVDGQGAGEEPVTRGEDLDSEPAPTSGWVLLLGAGIALLVAAVALRAAAPGRAAAGR